MIILTLFGTTVGLKVLRLPLAPPPATLKLEDAWIEITSSQLTVRPDKDAFVVFRKMVGPHLATWIGLYRKAREIGYDRSGGFYGAGAWLIDTTADTKLLKTVINNLADQIRSLAMDGDRFTQCILDTRASFAQPAQTAELVATLSRVTGGCSPGGVNAFVIGGTNPTEVIDWAHRGMSSSAFSKVIVGAHDQVPAGGVSSSTQLFPSLSLAIEGAYRRDVTSIRNELAQSKAQAQKIEGDLLALQERNKGLQEYLNRTLNDLEVERSNVHTLRSQALVIAESVQRDNRQAPLAQPIAHGNRHIQDSDLQNEKSMSLFHIILYVLTPTLLLALGGFFGYMLAPHSKNIVPPPNAASLQKPSDDSIRKDLSESQDNSGDSLTATSPSAPGPESNSTQIAVPSQTERPRDSATKAENPVQQSNTHSTNAKTNSSVAPKSPPEANKPAGLR